MVVSREKDRITAAEQQASGDSKWRPVSDRKV